MRKIINKQLEQYKNNNVALLFSGGMDSLSLLLSCLDVGIKPKLYTFRLEGYMSDDSIRSKHIAEIFNLDITEIIIEENLENLLHDISYIIEKFDVKKKTQIQCIQPFIHIVNHVKEDVVVSGICADDIYGTSKKMQIAGRKDPYIFNEKRRLAHENIQSSSYSFIKQIFEEYNKIFVAPYKDNNCLCEYILGKTFNQLHSPKQKNIMYESYKVELDKYKLYRRNSNLQVNSKIREYHNLLLLTDLNTRNYKSVVGIYNSMYKQIKER